MKRLTVLLVAAMVVSTNTACATPKETTTITVGHTSIVPVSKTELLQQRTNKVLAELKARIHKTWYVFSGDQPSGWDCSGLTRWAYAQLGYDIPHSAHKQATLGKQVSIPQPGDLVVFGYGPWFVHAAIYVGGNKVIHAGFRPGTQTEIISLSSPAFHGMRIVFRRILPLPQKALL